MMFIAKFGSAIRESKESSDKGLTALCVHQSSEISTDIHNRVLVNIYKIIL